MKTSACPTSLNEEKEKKERPLWRNLIYIQSPKLSQLLRTARIRFLLYKTYPMLQASLSSC